MPNHALESLQARTSRGAFVTPAPKLGRYGPEQRGAAIDLYGGQGSGNMPAHGGGAVTTHYLQIIWNADFRDGIQLAAGAS
jgi:hypothetical protein